jgi:hypothetical protein
MTIHFGHERGTSTVLGMAASNDVRYTLYIDDNFHYMDTSERYAAGEYATVADAIRAAEAIVDDDLASFYKPGMMADTLYRYYTTFGADPFVVSEDDRRHFSAWNYARERCQQICQ